jgi:2-oxoacid:acceptor oxidoreductase delta subunit (pyruvate/2-ketoisovalerate family)
MDTKTSYYHQRGKTPNEKAGYKKRELGGVIANDKQTYPKTGDWRFFSPEISTKCIGCGTCVTFCPESCIRLVAKNTKKQAKMDYDYCKGCGICAVVCPVRAIKMK